MAMIRVQLMPAMLTVLICGAACGRDGASNPDGSLVCQAPKVLRYERPGCGDQAAPRCGAGEQDGCAGVRCSCKGKVIGGCDYTREPFARYLSPATAQEGQDCDPLATDGGP